VLQTASFRPQKVERLSALVRRPAQAVCEAVSAEAKWQAARVRQAGKDATCAYGGELHGHGERVYRAV